MEKLPAASKVNGVYVIKHDGGTYEVHKQGNKWELNGKIFNKMREVKQHIVAGVEETAEVTPEKPGLWDCMSPVAIVVLLLEELGREPNAIEKVTLDSLGMYRDGKMEIETAKRELERAKNLLRGS